MVPVFYSRLYKIILMLPEKNRKPFTITYFNVIIKYPFSHYFTLKIDLEILTIFPRTFFNTAALNSVVYNLSDSVVIKPFPSPALEAKRDIFRYSESSGNSIFDEAIIYLLFRPLAAFQK